MKCTKVHWLFSFLCNDHCQKKIPFQLLEHTILTMKEEKRFALKEVNMLTLMIKSNKNQPTAGGKCSIA